MNENDKLRNLLAPLVDFVQSPVPDNNQPLPSRPKQPAPQTQSKPEKKTPKKRKKSPETKPKPKKLKKDNISIDDFI